MRLWIKLLALVFGFAPSIGEAAECRNKDALGFSRVVEIDVSVPKRYGANGNNRSPDYEIILRDHEVVLTFDDGPMPATTPLILDALDAQCTKAIFFAVGRRALAEPDILKDVFARGHVVAGHSWSHGHQLGLTARRTAVDEIENGFSAVAKALGQPIAPLFRFPFLSKSEDLMAYLKARGVAEFSVDIVSDDTVWHEREAEQIVRTTMARLDHQGRGIILLHDIKAGTARILPELLRRLQAGGYNVVRIVAKTPLQTDPAYDLSVDVLVAEIDARRNGSLEVASAAVQRPSKQTPIVVASVEKAAPAVAVEKPAKFNHSGASRLPVKVAVTAAVVTPKIVTPRIITPKVVVANAALAKAGLRTPPAKAKPVVVSQVIRAAAKSNSAGGGVKAKSKSSSFADTFGSLINSGK